MIDLTILNPRTYKEERVVATPFWGFSEFCFFLYDKTTVPDVFSNCSFTPRPQFEANFSDGQLLWLRDITS